MSNVSATNLTVRRGSLRTPAFLVIGVAQRKSSGRAGIVNIGVWVKRRCRRFVRPLRRVSRVRLPPPVPICPLTVTI